MPSRILQTPSSSGAAGNAGSGGFMLSVVVACIVLFSSCMIFFFGSSLLSPSSNGAGGAGGGSSPMFGARSGDSEFRTECPAGDEVERLNMDTREVGLAGNRRDRITALALQCKKAGRRVAAAGENSTFPKEASCTGGITGLNIWSDGSVIQRLQPKCGNGGTAAGHGSPVGTMYPFSCPAGKKMTGVAGWSGTDVNSLRVICR